MSTPEMTLIIHAEQLLTMQAESGEAGRVGLLEDAGVFIREGVVSWVGPWSRRPKAAKRGDAASLAVRVLTPGWIEPGAWAFVHLATEFYATSSRRPEDIQSSIEDLKGCHDDVDAPTLAGALAARTLDFVRQGVVAVGWVDGLVPAGVLEDALGTLQELPCTSVRVPPHHHPAFMSGAGGERARHGVVVRVPSAPLTSLPWNTPVQPIAASTPVALSTGSHPVWSMNQSLGLSVSMAVARYGWSPARALWSVTRGAATALGRPALGTIATGERANLTAWRCERYEELAYCVGQPMVDAVIADGLFAYWTEEDVESS
ncbi:MAG: amidohydrolase family protein [Myxococcota bacterium]